MPATEKRTASSRDVKTEALDDCFIFTLINTDRENWTTRSVTFKNKTKNVLEIKVGMMDGTRSELVIWGDGGADTVIKWILNYFRYIFSFLLSTTSLLLQPSIFLFYYLQLPYFFNFIPH